MSLTIVLAAQSEIEEAARYCRAISDDLARGLRDEVAKALRDIVEAPKH